MYIMNNKNTRRKKHRSNTKEIISSKPRVSRSYASNFLKKKINVPQEIRPNETVEDPLKTALKRSNALANRRIMNLCYHPSFDTLNRWPSKTLHIANQPSLEINPHFSTCLLYTSDAADE